MRSAQPKDLPNQAVAAALKEASAGAVVPGTRIPDHNASSAAVPKVADQEAAEEARSPEERKFAGRQIVRGDSRRFGIHSMMPHEDYHRCCVVVTMAGRRIAA